MQGASSVMEMESPAKRMREMEAVPPQQQQRQPPLVIVNPMQPHHQQQGTALASACKPCRQAKIKCERQLPCARCTRLGLQCVPQDRARGRPKLADGPHVRLGTGSSVEGSSAASSPRVMTDSPARASDAMSPWGDEWRQSGAWPSSNRSETLEPPPALTLPSRGLSNSSLPLEPLGPRGFHDLGLCPLDGEDEDGLDMFVATIDGGPSQSHTRDGKMSRGRMQAVGGTSGPIPTHTQHTPTHTYTQSNGGGGGGGVPLRGLKRSELLAQMWSNPFAREAQEKGIIVTMATSLAALHRERRVDLQRLLAGLRAQALAVLRYRDARMQSMLELTAAVVGINWRDSVDENEALEAQMSGGALGGGPALTKALREVQSIIEPWRDSASLLSYFVTVKGETRLCCDDGFAKLYMRDEQETTEINLAQTCPLFLWGRVLSPEDQHCFFTSVMHAFYGLGGQAGELALISKCVTRTGNEMVSLVRFRVLFSATGLACAFSITPLPDNKYLMDTSTADPTSTPGRQAASLQQPQPQAQIQGPPPQPSPVSRAAAPPPTPPQPPHTHTTHTQPPSYPPAHTPYAWPSAGGTRQAQTHAETDGTATTANNNTSSMRHMQGGNAPTTSTTNTNPPTATTHSSVPSNPHTHTGASGVSTNGRIGGKGVSANGMGGSGLSSNSTTGMGVSASGTTGMGVSTNSSTGMGVSANGSMGPPGVSANGSGAGGAVGGGGSGLNHHPNSTPTNPPHSTNNNPPHDPPSKTPGRNGNGGNGVGTNSGGGSKPTTSSANVTVGHTWVPASLRADGQADMRAYMVGATAQPAFGSVGGGGGGSGQQQQQQGHTHAQAQTQGQTHTHAHTHAHAHVHHLSQQGYQQQQQHHQQQMATQLPPHAHAQHQAHAHAHIHSQQQQTGGYQQHMGTSSVMQHLQLYGQQQQQQPPLHSPVAYVGPQQPGAHIHIQQQARRGGQQQSMGPPMPTHTPHTHTQSPYMMGMQQPPQQRMMGGGYGGMHAHTHTHAQPHPHTHPHAHATHNPHTQTHSHMQGVSHAQTGARTHPGMPAHSPMAPPAATMSMQCMMQLHHRQGDMHAHAHAHTLSSTHAHMTPPQQQYHPHASMGMAPTPEQQPPQQGNSGHMPADANRESLREANNVSVSDGDLHDLLLESLL